MTHCVKMKVVQLDGNILERIGIAIRLLRKGKGLTQLELSERWGVDRKFISSIERGNRNCSILTLCELLHHLDSEIVNFCTVDILLQVALHEANIFLAA